MNEKNSFVVFTDIEETLNELSDEQVGRLFRGMVAYADRKEEPEFDGLLKIAFIPIRQSILRTSDKWEATKKKRAEAGRLGGIKSGQVRRNEANEANEANASLLEANEANEAVSVSVSVPVPVSVSESVPVSTPVDVWSLSRSVLGYLNDRAGTSYRTDKAEYVKLISELSHQGYTEADMVRVIDVKCADWQNNPEMAQFLRPSTLFGDKFGEYLAQPLPEAVAKRERAEKRSADNAERVKAFEAELVTVQERIASADTPTRIRLREREAWLQDEIARLSG